MDTLIFISFLDCIIIIIQTIPQNPQVPAVINPCNKWLTGLADFFNTAIKASEFLSTIENPSNALEDT